METRPKYEKYIIHIKTFIILKLDLSFEVGRTGQNENVECQNVECRKRHVKM